MAENKSSATKWVILIVVIIVLVQAFSFFGSDSTQTEVLNTETSTSANSKLYRFNLTECLGKDLIKPATLTVDAASTNWLLDFNNGSSLTYTVISGNEYDPMCGLKAKDNNGDMCEICIKKNEDDRTTVTFDYSGKKMIYKGDYVR